MKKSTVKEINTHVEAIRILVDALRDEWSERSERWQESDVGQEADGGVGELESTDWPE